MKQEEKIGLFIISILLGASLGQAEFGLTIMLGLFFVGLFTCGIVFLVGVFQHNTTVIKTSLGIFALIIISGISSLLGNQTMRFIQKKKVSKVVLVLENHKKDSGIYPISLSLILEKEKRSHFEYYPDSTLSEFELYHSKDMYYYLRYSSETEKWDWVEGF